CDHCGDSVASSLCSCLISCYDLGILCFFFFPYSTDRLVLHSFPTRRSSDLRRRRDPARHQSRLGQSQRQTVPDAVYPGRRQVRRSEEHTSELQSLAYLVCRLLLEKKKQPTQLQYTVMQLSLILLFCTTSTAA